MACPSPRPRRADPDTQLFSLSHVLCLASDVQRAQPRSGADKFLAFGAHLDDVHLPILTGEHFLHSIQTPLTAQGVLINSELYIPNFQIVFRLSPFFFACYELTGTLPSIASRTTSTGSESVSNGS